MLNQIFAILIICFAVVTARPLKNRNDLPPLIPGEYVAKVKGDSGNFTMIWNIHSDSTYILQMKTDSGQSKNVKARGKYSLKEKSVNFWNTEQETKDGWVPLVLDPFPILEQNDTLLSVKIVESEARFIRQQKKK